MNVICSICSKPGHFAQICKNRFTWVRENNTTSNQNFNAYNDQQTDNTAHTEDQMKQNLFKMTLP